MKNKRIVVYALLCVAYTIAICIISLAQLQISNVVYAEYDPLRFEYFLLNLLLLTALFLLFAAPWRKISTGGFIFSLFTFILSTANLYTIKLHGSLLTIAELGNARTAFNVLKNYDLLSPSILNELLPAFLLLLLELGITFGVRLLLPDNFFRAGRIKRTVCFLGISLVLFSFLQTDPISKQFQPIRTSWNQTIYAKTYGYPLTVYVNAGKFHLNEPEGYSEDLIASNPPVVSDVEYNGRTTRPDIFLILNESFFDFSLVSDIKTDIDYLEQFYSIDGAAYGRAVSRSSGGTNSTEFELLTGIPQSLVGDTPFNVLDMNDCATVVSLLKQQGYYTIGTHCEFSQNYNRGYGYSRIHFDEVHFLDDYTWSMYDNRWGPTDESAYDNIITWYEQAQTNNKPVFTYLLTYQNHGGWNQNPPESDTVHLEGYTGEYSESEINEFLSCVQLSSKAIHDFCDYFRDSDRPVIICMLGDHSPSFTGSVITKELGRREKIEPASTPLLIWANFDLGIESNDLGYRSATTIAPLLLDLAGLQTSPYFQFILDLTDAYPVVTGWGEYTDQQGIVYSYETKDSKNAPIWDYFYLSYNNLLPESKDAWFTLFQG